LIDSHCHLYSEPLSENIESEIALAKENGVTQMVVIGIDMETNLKAVSLAEQHKEIFATVGCHPNHAAAYDPNSLKQIETWLAHPKVVGIGELGLDFHWDYATLEQQLKALHDQLELARKVKAPVIIHCREAYDRLVQELKGYEDLTFIYHCFAGTLDHAAELPAGFYGVDGPLTYKKADDLRQIIKSLPKEKILIETDAPYLPPVPYRGKPNRPAYLPHILECLAELWNMSPNEAKTLTIENTHKAFPKIAEQ